MWTLDVFVSAFIPETYYNAEEVKKVVDNLREEEVMAKYRIKKTSEGYKIQKRLFWFIYDTYGYEGVTEYGTVRSGTIFYKTEEEAIKYLDEIRTEEKQKPKMKKEEVVYEID